MLGQEQVGTLDNVLEVRLALLVDQLADVRNIDRLRSKYILSSQSDALNWYHVPSTARYKDVGLVTQMSAVPKVGAICNQFTS